MGAAHDGHVKQESSRAHVPDEKMSTERCAARLDRPVPPPQRHSPARGAADEHGILEGCAEGGLEASLQETPRFGAGRGAFGEIVGNDTASP